MSRLNRRNAGFTLIELMVVVAVVGLLAAIAVGRFDGARQRARQAEVKVNLAGIYTSEQAYYANNNTYSNDFVQLGSAPSRGNRYAYYIDVPATTMQMRTTASNTIVKGTDAISVDHVSYPSLTAAPTAFATDGVATFAANASGTVIPSGSAAYFKTGANGAFLIRAYGQINSTITSTYDSWFISSNGASVTSSCVPVNNGKISAGIPGSTYDQSVCR